MKKILTPSFALAEPNMVSARRKNDNDVCAMHECENKLSDPPSYGFLGVKICDECRKPIDKEIQEHINDTDKRNIEALTNCFKNNNGDKNGT